jgi:NAD+ synthase
MQEINFEIAEKVITLFIKDSISKHNFKNGIVGVSGGLDSAVVLVLMERALGPDHTFALILPYKTSSPEGLEHAKRLCSQLKVDAEEIDITPSVDAYFNRFPTDDPVLIGNKCARERMSILYDFSSRKKALVVGTSNKSELLIGYSTLFGDSAAAFFPLGDLYKTQLFDFAKHLRIPQEIIVKKPSADLWENQTDEAEIGIAYRELDEILFNLVDLRKKPEDIEKMGFRKENIEKIIKLVRDSQYKRTMPPILKLNRRTIGLDFRYLRDWHK